MTMPEVAAARLCELAVTHPDMPNPAARIGAWIIGYAAQNGGFPVELSFRQIQVSTGCHNATIRESVNWLVEAGALVSEPGAHRGGTRRAIRFLGVRQ